MSPTSFAHHLALTLVALGAAACSSDRAASESGAEGAPTWHQDVAPLVAEKCGSCHYQGGIAPFSVEAYETAQGWAGAMATATESGAMPPFLAQDTEECTPRLPWLNDIRLSAAEKALLRDWADSGAPEGDARTAATIQPVDLAEIEREDAVLGLPEPITVDGNKDIHRCVVVDPGFAEDTYVISRHVTAGNSKVLHHAVAYVLVPDEKPDGTLQTKAELEQAVRDVHGVGIGGSYDCFGGPQLPDMGIELLSAWAPGSLPNPAPPDSGQPLSKESLILFDLHYHPTGSPEVDADTRFSLMLTDERPAYQSRTVLIGNLQEPIEVPGVGHGDLLKQPGEEAAEFLVPAGVKDHVEEMAFTFELPPETDIRIYGSGTHMHYVGRNMRVSLSQATGQDECLIETPAWDFNWQRGYGYDAASLTELPLIQDGTVLTMRCVYDNTTGNPYVVDALREQGLDSPVPVLLGEDTLDEMCLAGIGILFANP